MNYTDISKLRLLEDVNRIERRILEAAIALFDSPSARRINEIVTPNEPLNPKEQEIRDTDAKLKQLKKRKAAARLAMMLDKVGKLRSQVAGAPHLN